MDRLGDFAVRDVVDFAFCPRIIYFRYVIRRGKERTPKMQMGARVHGEFSKNSRRRRLVDGLPKLRRRYGINLHSRRYGMNTRIDCVLVDDERGCAYPVEFKSTTKPGVLYKTHRYQVVMQALIVEEVMGMTVPCGYLKYLTDNSLTRVATTRKIREEVTEAVREMEEIIKNERIPGPTPYKKRCVNCFHFDHCRRM